MSRKTVSVLLVCLLLLSGCTCKHQWKDATCAAPKTCSLCAETEGVPLEHTFQDATCYAPKTCINCGEAIGTVAPHEWADATCHYAKTCTKCGTSEGEPLEHTWKAATCTQPKSCIVCKATEGTVIAHDYSDATLKEPQTCKRCRKTVGTKLTLDDIENEEISLNNGKTFLFDHRDYIDILNQMYSSLAITVLIDMNESLNTPSNVYVYSFVNTDNTQDITLYCDEETGYVYKIVVDLDPNAEISENAFQQYMTNCICAYIAATPKILKNDHHKTFFTKDDITYAGPGMVIMENSYDGVFYKLESSSGKCTLTITLVQQ